MNDEIFHRNLRTSSLIRAEDFLNVATVFAVYCYSAVHFLGYCALCLCLQCPVFSLLYPEIGHAVWLKRHDDSYDSRSAATLLMIITPRT